MPKTYRIKIDCGDEVEIVQLQFDSPIDAVEYCEKNTTPECKYTPLSDKKVNANRGDT